MSTTLSYSLLMSTKNEEILGAWAEFFVSHALAVRAIESEMEAQSPLSMDGYDVLLAISRAPRQRLRFSDLADTTVYTRSGITRIMKRYEDKGYISREECPEDKRGSFAVLTDEGKRALREAWRWYSKGIIQVFGNCFSEKEAQTLRSLMQKLADSLSTPKLVQLQRKKLH